MGDLEISIDGYCAIRRDRNRKGGSVICYVTNMIFYNNKNCISNEIGNNFIKLLIPKTKPITVGIIYKPPDWTRFLEILSDSLNSLVKRTIAYSRESEYKVISGRFNISTRK